LQETRKVPFFDVPEHQTVSSGMVMAVLTRHVHPGPWVRTTPYYALDDQHRARDFQNEHGEVWSACEVLYATHRGWRLRLILAPADLLPQRLAEAQSELAVPLICSAAWG